MIAPLVHSSDAPLLTKQDVAERWGCSTKTVERHVADGDLRVIHLGRLVRFRREDVWAAEKKMRK
jgi:excisionase family DNA binding protein